MENEQGIKHFFGGYASKFDSIYGDGAPRGFFDRVIDKLFRQSMYNRYKKTIEFISMHGNEVKTVLDIGCGSGRYATEMANLGCVVTGVDLAEEMLELARESSHKAGFDKNQFIVGNYFDIQLPEQHDATILMGVMDYISNPEELFVKLKADTGKFILASFPKAGGVLAWQRKIRYNMRDCPLYYYTKESIAEILDHAEIEQYKIEDNDREYFLTVTL